MVDVEQIIQFVSQIVEVFGPQRVILFGSYAYGSPTEDSDVDLLVVMPHIGAPYKKAAQISSAIPHSFGCDLLVRSMKTLQERIVLNDFFLKEITEKGITLYDASDAGMGRKGRRRLRVRKPRAAIAQISEL
jgi:predicted nucleotidyltransferase